MKKVIIFRGNVNILTLYEARFSTEHESIASRPTGTVTFTTGPTNRGISVKILKKKIQIPVVKMYLVVLLHTHANGYLLRSLTDTLHNV